ncbi:MAG: hypothetical protein NC453_27505, partial [Muribaculum sp.]|nr:hypothetical protein [Muribaculum sp.]
YKADIERYLPDVPDLLFWGQYCATIGFPDSYIHRILSFEKVGFKELTLLIIRERSFIKDLNSIRVFG